MLFEQGQSPQSLEYWLSGIESTWKQTPEFSVPANFEHLAVICDGNRRSAKEKGLNPWEGHRLGIEVIKGIMQAGRDWGIKHLTFWAWSTENWKRDEGQVSFVMNLAARHLADSEALRTLVENRTKFTHIGRKDRLPMNVLTAIDNLERNTAGFSERYVNLALDYGGRDEVSRATAKIVQDAIRGRLVETDILANPELIQSYLDTAGQPLPDLVVRTGSLENETPHTSGFMPLQTEYSGWRFIPTLFPDLTPDSFLTEIQKFLVSERRFGK